MRLVESNETHCIQGVKLIRDFENNCLFCIFILSLAPQSVYKMAVFFQPPFFFNIMPFLNGKVLYVATIEIYPPAMWSKPA